MTEYHEALLPKCFNQSGNHRHGRSWVTIDGEAVELQVRAVDPENRLLARELERRIEVALKEVEAVRTQAEIRGREIPSPFSAEERERLFELTHDLPSVWRAPTTCPQDRSRIVRCMIDQVVVNACHLKADVHWYGGEISTIEAPRGNSGIQRHVAKPELIDMLRELACEFSDAQIARIMHRRRLRTPKDLHFTAHRVACLRNNHGISPGPRVPVRGEDIYTAEQTANILGVTTVIRWADVGLLKAAQLMSGAQRIQVPPADVRRLTTADAPAGWMTLKAASAALGVSHQIVLQKLKSGELEGCRVRTGRRTAWRINVPADSGDQQPTLFEQLGHD